MRIVVDSAMLDTDSRIARIVLQPRTRLNFYATEKLLSEIEEHSDKLKEISGYTEAEYKRALLLFSQRIRFINVNLIPKTTYLKASHLTEQVDIDDTEFVALTDHIRGKFWSGDKELVKGLSGRGWNKFISTADLFEMVKEK